MSTTEQTAGDLLDELDRCIAESAENHRKIAALIGELRTKLDDVGKYSQEALRHLDLALEHMPSGASVV